MAPNHILFPVTWQCNLTCKFCCSRNRNADINIKDCLNLIRSKKNEVEWVYITGGEPFLLGSNLINICEQLQSDGFKVGVTTNGTIDPLDIFDHIDRLGVSIDGDENYHDAYRGKGVFKKAVTLIKKLSLNVKQW